MELNVYNKPLMACCYKPITGFFRDGFCRTTKDDFGTHTVCAVVTKDFLDYSASRGNDLITPIPQWNFLGLKPGDKWCLCISRWLEAENAGKAPKVILEATHIKSLQYTSLDILKKYEYQD
ncbi:DUF2237 family protein [Polaribacter porphyrae]|uniref:DUF2237 domain-containing protein n=1 Tax=Polaribacter porphyrae TaxID=1137780 RepID=A0A2S7WSA6_9FLAO|nr:DUF2237 domain-containing protein [Polaribacter porphyrae]PQJ80473.1 hypothetical protein BTO18_15405 [Polaribacter porphyrae]